MKNKNQWFFSLAILLFISSVALIYVKEKHKSWIYFQKKYNKLASLLGKPTIKLKPIVIKTQWGTKEYCLTCHVGIKDISKSHPTAVFGCTICHGGDPLSLDVKEAHKGLIGGKNPSDLRYFRRSCGRTAPNGAACHGDSKIWYKNHIKRVNNTLMATMAGVIDGILTHWKASFNGTFSAVEGSAFKKIPRVSITRDTSNFALAVDHFRKLCAKCHIGVEAKSGTSSHAAGCAACHVLYNKSGTYDGLDPTIPRDEFGHPRYHRFTIAIPTQQCLHCHNRSGREGINYVGLMENAFYGTPYVNGTFGGIRLMGGRFLFRMQADIHYEKGMHCIDCHIGVEIMGNGKAYKKMFEQLKIRCEDCHGSYNNPPKGKEATEGDYATFVAFYNENYDVSPGDTVGLTASGEVIPNLKYEKGSWYLYSKVTGKKYRVKIITHSPKHRFPCQQKLECYSCHSSWAPLCFGCHDVLDLKKKQWDYIAKEYTNGRWREYRGFLRFDKIILGVDPRGKIAPLLFCQSEAFLKEGKTYKKGPKAFVAVTMNPHTTGRHALRCVDCHKDKVALGLGSGIYKSKSSGMDFPYSPDTVVVNGTTIMEPGIKGVRGLNRKEIEKALSVDIPICEKH